MEQEKLRDEKGRILKGKHVSIKTEFKKGQICLTKGKTRDNCEILKRAGEKISKTKHSKEWKEIKGVLAKNKISIKNKGKHYSPKTEFKKGLIPKNKRYLDENFIIEEFNKKDNAKKIAIELNVSPTLILKILKKNNINTSRKGKKFSEERRQLFIHNLGKYAEKGSIPPNLKYPERRYFEKEIRKCLCGCGRDVIGWNKRKNTPVLYCPGHNPLTEKTKKILEEKVYSKRRNKYFEEIHGEEKAKLIRKQISRKLSGENNPNYGKKHTEERKLQNRNKKLEYYQSEEGILFLKRLSILFNNKTLEERYGFDKAELIRKKISAAEQEISLSEWKEFKGNYPYPITFSDKFKLAIKQRDGFQCLKCGMREEDHIKLFGRRQVIHHIDYVYANTFSENCCVLCNRCNGEVNSNRISWKKFFQSLLSERYGYQYSKDGKIIINLNEEVINGTV